MKKFLALLMALSMVLSLCMVPVASADESTATEAISKTVAPVEASEVVFTDKIENITDNLLYPSSTSYVNGGFALDVRSSNIAMKNQYYKGTIRSGALDSKDETKTIHFAHLYDDNARRNTETIKTLQYYYDQGCDTLILGYGIPSNVDGEGAYTFKGTYSGTNNNTNGVAITGKPFDGAYIKSVASPTGENDKVLEYNFGTTGNNNSRDRYYGITMKILAGSKDIQVAEGKKLAYSWDIYVPTDAAPLFPRLTDDFQALGGISVDGGDSRLLKDITYYTSNTLTYRVTGTNPSTGSTENVTFAIPTNQWNTLMQVVEYNGTANPLITVYLNGEKITKLRSANKMQGDATNGFNADQLSITGGPVANAAVASSVKYRFFVDDVKQYFIEDDLSFDISVAQSAYTDFDPSSDKAAVEFTSQADITSLANAVTVTKNGKNVGVTASARKTGAYTAEISFSGMVADGSTYDVAISQVTDIYGNTSSAPASFKVTTCRNSTIVPAEAGEVIFTDKIENITENLLYPSKTGFVNGGITVDVREQARSHKNDLTRAGVIKSTDAYPATVKKVYSYDATGSQSPTLEDAYAEGYDTLLIGNGLGATYSGTNGATGTAIAGSPFKGAYVKSVPSPTGEKDKVLHYTFGTNGENDSYCQQGHYRGIVVHMFAGSTRTFTTVGEKMVYSWNVYVPANVAGEFANDGYQALGGIDIGGNSRLLQDRTYTSAGKLIYRVTGKESADAASGNKTFEIPTDQWNTLKQVVEYDGTAYPVVTVYLNGVEQAKLIADKALKGSAGAYYPGQLWISGGPKIGSKDLPAYNFYVDDIMQYMLKDGSDLSIASATASVSGGKVSATVSVKNALGENLPAFIAVAVYGANDEMLGIKFVNTTVASSGYNGTLEVDIQDRSGEIVKAKAFLWDGYATMIPYQNAVDVTVQ